MLVVVAFCDGGLALYRASWRADLASSIRRTEPELLAYARAVRTGEIRPGPNGALPIPRLPAGAPTIECVLLDGRGNLTFQTDHSLDWDVGFVLRTGDAPVSATGHGQVTVEPLFGPWWIFDDFGP